MPAKAIGKVFSEQRIGEEKDGDGGKNPAVGAPGHLEDQDDDNRGKEQVRSKCRSCSFSYGIIAVKNRKNTYKVYNESILL